MAENNDVNENKIIEILDNKNIIINIGKNIEKEVDSIQEPNEENLYYFFFKRDIYNENGTRIKEKKKYISLIKIFNEYLKETNDFIFLYFKKIDIDFIKIIFNGFISFDFEDINEKQYILDSIKKIIPLFFSKNLFYIIYNQFSKIYRRFNLSENKELLFNKFCKIFELWKLIYDVNDKEKVNSSYITFIGRKDLALINNNNYIGYQFKEINIYIEFEDGFCPINDMETELIKVIFIEYGTGKVEYKDIITPKDNSKNKENKKINNILFKINEESISYVLNKSDNFDINNSENFIRVVELESPSNFGQVETFRNYIGKIKKINISIEFKDENIQKYYYEITPKENKEGYEIKKFEETEGYIGLSFEFGDEIKLISSKIHNEILYEDIRYYGGLESFLPIIKIIKYFISHFKEKEDIIKKLNEILIEIMKTIFKFICYSKINFENFKNILVPLLGALAEINHVYPSEKIKDLYSNNIFSLFYIIIISSSFPFALKKSYMKITGLYNIAQLNLNFDDLIIDKDKLNISSYKWYSTLLMIIIEFYLLKLNDINKIPKTVIYQILLLQTNIEKGTDLTQYKNNFTSYIKCGLNCLNYIIKSENKENNLLLINNNIEKISDYLSSYVLNNEYNLSFILLMLKVYLNLLNLESFWIKSDEEKHEEEKNTYKIVFEKFFNMFEKIIKEAKDDIKNIIITSFEDYIVNKDYLIKIFPFLSSKNFKLETENILSELTDFHRSYHNIMKRLFIFNKLWSDKKLFFDTKKREKYLKYKSINYYTKNYQKPFIFPDLDYKSTYPAFTCFDVKKELYIEEENKDEYNFDLDCPEFDEFNIKYEEEIIENIKKKGKINYYDVCLVKRTHHIKGIMFVCNDGNSLIKKIIFYSYPKTIYDSMMCCNSYSKNLQNVNKKNQKLCFGAVFVCPEKYMNIKIIIPVKDIRMVLKKIYFYRKSALEIFTKNKSYYFNFADKSAKYSEKNLYDFTNTFAFFSEFSPIKIREEIIGHSRKNEDISKSYINKEKKNETSNKVLNKYISSLFEHWTSNENEVEFSTLDLLIYLNLFSNRSYIDLFQYPVFPLPFFYDKVKENTFNYVDRKLSQHIGFQTVTEKSKRRKALIVRTYEDSLKEFEETPEDEEGDVEPPSYFTTHFSNNFYVSNFLLRLFPYSFLAIELQGSGFDSPNRLFFSIEDTFNNISYHKSDLRELIPEFYYFPEMLWNLNKLNFGKRQNGSQVEDVLMPQDMTKIDREKNKERNSINLNDEYEKSDYFRSFKFIEKMRNLLESKQTDIVSWINIIFGPGQKYNNPKKEDLYFRNGSYIDYSDVKIDELKAYRHDQTAMTSVEFGLTPIQTVFEGDTNKSKNRNNIYNYTVKDNKETFKTVCKSFVDRIIKTRARESKDCKDNVEKTSINKEDNNRNKNEQKYIKRLRKIISSNKINDYNPTEENKSQINNIFIDSETYIKCIFQNENIKIVGFKTGKIEVFKVNENDRLDLITEIFDHSDEICYIYYNQRLNMICTSSKDGFINAYSLPNKLITTIKNPNNNYFNMVFLCSNPFPSIVAFEQESLNFFSYSINGYKIKQVNLYNLLEIEKEKEKEKKRDIYICSYFNERGGTFKDRLIFIENNPNEKENVYKCHLIKVPFFDREDRIIEIKRY